jgi:hypothetical protein
LIQSFQIFISHFTSEKEIARVFQEFIQEAFPGIRVFRSSDAESIKSGEGQYNAIMAALKTTQVLIALLSSESSRRPWVAFESGHAIARDVEFFPMLVRGATAERVPSPFSEMLLRELGKAEVEKVLSSIGRVTGRSPSHVDVDRFLSKLREAESILPDSRLELEPYIETQVLHFRLRYEGHKPLTLQSITVGVPNAICDQNWHAEPVPGHLEVDRKMIGDVLYYVKAYLAVATPPDARSGAYWFKILKPSLLPSKDPRDLFELRFPLNKEIDVSRTEHLIRYRIETTEFEMGEITIPMSSIPTMK